MTIADIIEERCKKYSGARCVRKGASITVQPDGPETFPVHYSPNGGGHAVSYLGWHEEFENPEDALDCFAFGLSKECRLQVWMKGGFQYRWAVEAQDSNGIWKEDSRTGLLFFPYWKSTTIKLLQNDLII